MKVSQDAILQAAATITAAKIQVGGALAAAGGEKVIKAMGQSNINSAKVLEESVAEVLAALDHIEKNKTATSLKTWAELGKAQS